jgi:hypothetical protein
MVLQTGEASLVREEDGFFESAPPPHDGDEAIARHLGGCFAELLQKSGGNPRVARVAIQAVGWRVALQSKIGIHDINLVGAMLTDAVVLRAFDQTALVIASALASTDLQAMQRTMMTLEVGQAMEFGRPVVH